MQYDIVIIGSGLGGLECAYILAKEGYSVCVLEKNRQFGGNLQIFARDKVIFDTGVHYIGGLDEGQNLYQYFNYFGLMSKLKLRRMDENGFDRICFKDDPIEYKYAMGSERFVERLLENFPKEKAGLKKYMAGVQKMCRSFPLYNVKYGRPEETDLSLLNINAEQFIRACTSNHKLQQVLAGTNPLYVGYPERTPLYVHALVTNTYMDSAWKCVDGGAQIARILVESIRKMGGVVRKYATVKKLVFGSHKEVEAVELANGERILGKKFIANIEPAQLLKMIEPGKLRPAYRNRVKSLDNSMSVFTLHLVFKKQTFPYLNHNYYYYARPDVWSGVTYDPTLWPEGFAAFIPANSKSPDFADSMNIMTYMRYEEVQQWANTFNTTPHHINDRGADYQAFKQEKAEQLLDLAEQKFPNLRSKIKSYYSTTPLTYRDYIGTSDGTMYGIVKDCQSPLRTFLAPKTKIPNLFLTGQNVNMHGMLGVTVSTMATCAHFVGMKYLLEQVKKA